MIRLCTIGGKRKIKLLAFFTSQTFLSLLPNADFYQYKSIR